MEELSRKLDRVLESQTRMEAQQHNHSAALERMADAVDKIADVFVEFKSITRALLGIVSDKRKGETFMAKALVGAASLALLIGVLYMSGYRLEAKHGESSVRVGQ